MWKFSKYGAVLTNQRPFLILSTHYIELELELVQSHMAQKPVLRGEVCCACVAREVSVERGGMGEHIYIALLETQ